LFCGDEVFRFFFFGCHFALFRCYHI
jgi:hypothetical protein